MSRLTVNQFMAVGSRYGITSFSVSPRQKVLDSFASSLTVFPKDVHSSFNDSIVFYLSILYFISVYCVCFLCCLVRNNKE